jgi:hypothetical protein
MRWLERRACVEITFPSTPARQGEVPVDGACDWAYSAEAAWKRSTDRRDCFIPPVYCGEQQINARCPGMWRSLAFQLPPRNFSRYEKSIVSDSVCFTAS